MPWHARSRAEDKHPTSQPTPLTWIAPQAGWLCRCGHYLPVEGLRNMVFRLNEFNEALHKAGITGAGDARQAGASQTCWASLHQGRGLHRTHLATPRSTHPSLQVVEQGPWYKAGIPAGGAMNATWLQEMHSSRGPLKLPNPQAKLGHMPCPLQPQGTLHLPWHASQSARDTSGLRSKV